MSDVYTSPRVRRPRSSIGRYTVVRDSREKAGKGWQFPATTTCAGTVVAGLKTGDYSLQGLEHIFTIDRKGTAVEFVGNLHQPRFLRELERMKAFELAIVMLEFDFDVLAFWHARHPKIHAVPRHWTVPGAVEAKYWEVQLAHPHVHFLFAGPYAERSASSLFKRAWARYGPRVAVEA